MQTQTVKRVKRHLDLNFGKCFGPKDGQRTCSVHHRVTGKLLYEMSMNRARCWCFRHVDDLMLTEAPGGSLGDARDAVSADWTRREAERGIREHPMK